VKASHPCDTLLLPCIRLTTMTVQMLAPNQGKLRLPMAIGSFFA
jgi:hypothetical protein